MVPPTHLRDLSGFVPVGRDGNCSMIGDAEAPQIEYGAFSKDNHAECCSSHGGSRAPPENERAT